VADDGTCWLNLGDSYSAGGSSPTYLPTYLGPHLTGRHTRAWAPRTCSASALALQDDGWILRNAIIWRKPNAMPESVRDCMSCRHELIFLLVKSALLVRADSEGLEAHAALSACPAPAMSSRRTRLGGALPNR
jgi:hypothetical protein